MWKKTLLFSFPFILGMGLNSPVSALDAYPTLRLAQAAAPDNTGRNEREQRRNDPNAGRPILE